MDRVIALVAILASSLSLCAGHCPDGWVYFQGSCYLFSHEGRSFTEAENYCLQHQAHLAKVENSVEDHFIKSFSADLIPADRWLGLTDTDIEGFWKWTDGSSANYINWHPGQPEQGKSANCLALHPAFNYGWVDEPCWHTYMPICEKAESCDQPGGESIIG